MEKPFSAAEVVEMGMAIERRSCDLYARLAEAVSDAQAGEIFLFLVKEKTGQLAQLKEMAVRLKQQEPLGQYSDDYAGYIRDLSEEFVIAERSLPATLARGLERGQALQMGIDREKDTALFYEGIKDLVPAAERGYIEKLIIQERRHMRRLIAYKRVCAI